jgi:RimJ/RimL family protein N-acetyltransferase
MTSLASSERLEIKALKPENQSRYFELIATPSWGKYDEEFPKTGAAALEAFEYSRDMPVNSINEWNEYALFLKETGNMIGMVSHFNRVDARLGTVAKIGYHLDPALHGRGLGREAADLLLSFLKGNGVNYAEALVDYQNDASINILTKAGFARLESSLCGAGEHYYRLRLR